MLELSGGIDYIALRDKFREAFPYVNAIAVNQTIGTGAWTDISTFASVADPWAFRDTGTPANFNIRPTRGIWAINAIAIWENDAGVTGDRGVRIVNNSGTTLAVLYVPVGASGDSSLTCNNEIVVFTGTYMKLQVFQSSGGDLDVTQGAIQLRYRGPSRV